MGSIWGRFGVDPSRVGVDLGSMWGRFGVELVSGGGRLKASVSIWGRFDAAWGSTCGRFGVDLVRFGVDLGPTWGAEGRLRTQTSIWGRFGGALGAISGVEVGQLRSGSGSLRRRSGVDLGALWDRGVVSRLELTLGGERGVLLAGGHFGGRFDVPRRALGVSRPRPTTCCSAWTSPTAASPTPPRAAGAAAPPAGAGSGARRTSRRCAAAWRRIGSARACPMRRRRGSRGPQAPLGDGTRPSPQSEDKSGVH